MTEINQAKSHASNRLVCQELNGNFSIVMQRSIKAISVPSTGHANGEWKLYRAFRVIWSA